MAANQMHLPVRRGVLAMSKSRKTALITGASSGIGLELAKCFAADGHNVVLVSRSEDELRKIAQDLEKNHGIDAIVIAKDLFDSDAAFEVYEAVKARDIEVNYLV